MNFSLDTIWTKSILFVRKWEKVVTHDFSRGSGVASHVPVLEGEILAWLGCKPGGVYLDCTIGQGGHAARILEQMGPDGVLIGIDRDPAAIAATGARLAREASRVRLVCGIQRGRNCMSRSS